MLDFGPWHSHHAFGFERFNMDLKSAKTNHKGSIETTIAHKFLRSIHREDFFSGQLPNMGANVDMEQLKSVYVGNDIYGLGQQQYQNAYLSHELEVSKDEDFNLIDFVEYAGSLDGSSPPNHAYGFEPLPCSTIQSLKINKLNSLLKEVEYVQLVNYYKTYFNPDDDLPYIYGKDDYITNDREIVKVNQRVAKFKSVSILGQKYNSLEATSFRGSYIHAYYRDTSQLSDDHQLRPAQIQFFFRHAITIMNNDNKLELVTLTFAYVRWYKELNPESHVTTFNTINSSCYSNTFTDPSYMDILPVHCIHSPIGLYLNVIDNHNIVIDIPRRITE